MSGNHNEGSLDRARYRRALWWLDRGVELVPLKARSKVIQRGYGPRKAHIQDARAAEAWFLKAGANLAVVLGATRGLIIADWDDVEDYAAWRDTSGAQVDTLTERTARGYHAFFFGEGLPSAVGDGCEFKASGVCTVSPSVHPTGALYQIVHYVPIARLGHQEACTFFPFLRETLARRAERQQRYSASTKTPVKQGIRGEGSVVTRIKAARSTVEEMEAAGIVLRPAGENTLVGLCPFHDDHRPSLWVYTHNGLWGCNHPGCKAAGLHDVINFRALVQGISNSAAIQQLAREL
ncbi:MAG: bifunctional DNA primase/polymerase [Anaerolineae bacterium]|nr:bifunctional DNA primase/polymerase [Anaerolineae bacterium]